MASHLATQLNTPLISSATHQLNTPLSGSTTQPRASASATKLKVKRRKGVQKKKVARKNSSSETGKSQRSKRSTVDPLSPAYRRAMQIHSEVSNHHPSFTKGMLRSIVVVGYWLGIPKIFCDHHMPEEDSMFILEDEEGKEYTVKYLGEKKGLSGGWQLFAKQHKLIVGDVLVFQLIRPFRFKVYIVPCERPKENDAEVDAARSLLHLDGSSSRQHDSADAAHQENHPSSNAVIHDDDDDGTATPSELGIMEDTTVEENVVGCECMNGGSAVATTPCEQVISFEDFRIVVDDLVLDSFMPEALRMKYYDLCVSQQMLLHEHVLRGQNCQLAVGMIHEVVDIAEAIKGSNLGSVADNFTLWHKKLRGLRIWGMSVDFLIDRLEQLMVLALKSEEYEEVRDARERAEERRKRLEMKVEAVKSKIGRLDGRLYSLDPQRLGAEFRALSCAPW